MFKKTVFCFSLLSFFFSLQSVKIGYALSGGGARGFAHIGILKVLEEVGIKPDYIAGTSIGALIGGLYAMGYKAQDIENLLSQYSWDEILNDSWKRDELYVGQKRWTPYGNATFRLNDKWLPRLPQSLIVGNRINLELFKLYSPASEINDFRELPIPFTAVATDLIRGNTHEFDSGSLMQGIRASMSIPSVLLPFPLNESLYIDGGLSQNLPSRTLLDMGAEYIIGFKVNTSLQKKEKLEDLLQILDQTINIGITNKLKEQMSLCDLILEPDLEGFSYVKFEKIAEIIQTGENYARSRIDELIYLKNCLYNNSIRHETNKGVIQQQIYNFEKIIVHGNKYTSSSIIKDYSGLKAGHFYTTYDVIKRVNQVWNSQLFDVIYPVISSDSTGHILKLYVQEQERKNLLLNFSYDNDNEFVAGIMLKLNNYILKNSNLAAEIKLGGKNELNLDYVKNFGQAYGFYYRLYPFLNEKRIYFYNDNHEKVTSVRSLEYGFTAGLGLFAGKSIVLESYGFNNITRLYKEIAITDTLEASNKISGIGIKAYHESLDDYIFPTKGTCLLLKLITARKNYLSDQALTRLTFKYEIFYPMNRSVSLLLGTAIGSHLVNNKHSSLDPFYLGGIDQFAGYQLYEKSAPFYEIIESGAKFKLSKFLFVSAKIQGLNYADNEDLIPNGGFLMGCVFELGYKSIIGPARFALAISEKTRLQYYFSIGYTKDFYHFSRR